MRTAPRLPVYHHDRAAAASVCSLTEREREVLSIVSLGRSAKEIASALGISARTAKQHIAGILVKFGVSTRLELLAALSHPSPVRPTIIPGGASGDTVPKANRQRSQ
jgi:DNA-binding CsgD family transcriptional regulator